jgi:hypothetical protein
MMIMTAIDEYQRIEQIGITITCPRCHREFTIKKYGWEYNMKDALIRRDNFEDKKKVIESMFRNVTCTLCDYDLGDIKYEIGVDK